MCVGLIRSWQGAVGGDAPLEQEGIVSARAGSAMTPGFASAGSAGLAEHRPAMGGLSGGCQRTVCGPKPRRFSGRRASTGAGREWPMRGDGDVGR